MRQRATRCTVMYRRAQPSRMMYLQVQEFIGYLACAGVRAWIGNGACAVRTAGTFRTGVELDYRIDDGLSVHVFVSARHSNTDIDVSAPRSSLQCCIHVSTKARNAQSLSKAVPKVDRNVDFHCLHIVSFPPSAATGATCIRANCRMLIVARLKQRKSSTGINPPDSTYYFVAVRVGVIHRIGFCIIPGAVRCREHG